MRSRTALALVGFAAVALPVLTAAPALAHIGIFPAEAHEGTTGMFRLVVEHDCDGSPTTSVSADLSPAFTDVEPEAVDGWRMDQDGGTVTWTAEPGAEGSVGVFRFEARVSATAGTTVAIPVTHECVDETIDWAQEAAAGQDPAELLFPAPVFSATRAPVLVTGTSPEDAAGDEDTGDEGMGGLATASLILGVALVAGSGAMLLRGRRPQ
jgi:uncharacterized protein YcnI